MKSWRTLFILPGMTLILLAAATSFAQDEGDNEPLAALPSPYASQVETGRYRLFDGQLSVASLKGPDVSERHLMKIDTVTGQVWIGKQVQYLDKRGKVIQHRYWEPFEQYLTAAPERPRP